MSNYSLYVNLNKAGISLRKLVLQSFTDSNPKPEPDPLAQIFPYDRSQVDVLSRQGAGVYWCVNPQTEPTKRGINNTAQWAAIGLDLDVAKEQDRLDQAAMNVKKSEITQALNNLLYPPTGIIETKNGLQPYWLFNDPLILNTDEERQQANEEYKLVVKGLAKVLGHKSEGDSISRVLRFEGTLHQKNPNNAFDIKSIGGTGELVNREQFAITYLLPESSTSSSKTFKPVTSDQGQSIYDSDVVEGLTRLSGHQLVNSEVYELEDERSGKRQIIINGQRSGQWIDVASNAIGGHPGGEGSYNLVRWVKWYQQGMTEEEVRKQLDVVILDKPSQPTFTFNSYQLEIGPQGYITITREGLIYKVREAKDGKYEVNLYQNEKLINRDSMNLVSNAARKRFVKGCLEQSELDEKLLTEDLLKLQECLDEINRQIVKSELDETNKEQPTPEEFRQAESLLKSPTLMFDILAMIKKLGVAGEEITALLHYLVLTSRITDEPLSVIVKGESSVGKSYVLGRVMLLFPRDAYIDITDATAQSFFYAEENHFSHKIIVIFELHGSSKSDYSIRTLQSEKKLKIQVTVKDPDTGEFMTKEREVNGPTGFITTTTNAQIHAENETRQLSIFPDESVDQTERTFEMSDAKYRGIQNINNDQLKPWQTLQTILKPYPVFIPFVDELRKSFPKKPVRVRRDYNKLLAIIAVIALLHQKQREITEVDEVAYVVATLTDFHIAKVLLETTLQKTIYSIPPKTEQLLEAAKQFLKNNFNKTGVSVRDVASELGWDYDTAKKWFDPGFQKGFFKQTQEHKGSQAALYQPTDKTLPSQTILPYTEDLYAINPEWLGNQAIYVPISGQQLKLEPDE